MSPPPERARYRQLADELRRRILTGEYPPGSILPTEPALMAESGLSRPMVREAISVLRAEGLVYTERARGTFVRLQPPVRRIGSERYRREMAHIDATDAAPGTSFTHDQGIAWSDYDLDRDFAEVEASEPLAELLAVPVGTPLLERRFTFKALGQVQQLSRSYVAADLVRGTPIEDPANEPWPGGTIAQLWSLGLRVTWVREQVRTRMPDADEAEVLRLSPGIPVLAVTRQMFAEDRPVEAAVDIILPGDRVVLDYRIDL